MTNQEHCTKCGQELPPTQEQVDRLKAYDHGWDARRNDRPITSNTYEPGTQMFDEFNSGWQDCDKVRKDNFSLNATKPHLSQSTLWQ